MATLDNKKRRTSMEIEDIVQDTSRSNTILYKEKYCFETSLTGTIESINSPIHKIGTEGDERKKRGKRIGKENINHLENNRSASKRSRGKPSEQYETKDKENGSIQKQKVEETDEEVFKKRKNSNESVHSAIGVNVIVEKKKKERVLHRETLTERKIKKTIKKLKSDHLENKEEPITREDSLKQEIVKIKQKTDYLTVPKLYGRKKSFIDMDDSTEKEKKESKPKSTGREIKIKKEKEPTSRIIEKVKKEKIKKEKVKKEKEPTSRIIEKVKKEKIKKEVIVKKEMENEKHTEEIKGNERKTKSMSKTGRVKKEICEELKIKIEIGPASANIIEDKKVKPKKEKIEKKKIQKIGIRKSKRIEEMQKKNMTNN